ncbi:MAG: hypothetical protein QOF51_1516 [Chloroflexota bacterium]|jgi:membrane associated rhomboid family serine protease|nr:hypothetical protein [Chloroflexota bacterium]
MIPLSDLNRTRTFPWVMILIIIANVIVFVYELTLSSRQLDVFTQAFGTVPLEIATGRDLPPPSPQPVYLTLITAMFIHGGFLHIGSNMLYLWVFGDNVEDAFGHIPFAIFYVICGIIAGLTQVFIDPNSTIPSVGASGAIAGVLGAYIVLFPQAQVRTLLVLGWFITVTRISAVFLIGFWFLTQLVSGVASLGANTQQTGGVAVWAHVGGFVAGLAIAFLFGRGRRPAQSPAW